MPEHAFQQVIAAWDRYQVWRQRCDNPLRPGGVPISRFGSRDGRLCCRVVDRIASRWSST